MTDPDELVRYVEAPSEYLHPRADDPPAVFLAGGIPHCPDWQAEAVAELRRHGVPMVVINPRRRDFPFGDPAAAVDQVRWEHRHLHLPGLLTVFWFPACDPRFTVQPSTLVELGAALGENRPMVVGVDPGYPRADVVRLQCSTAGRGVIVHSQLSAVLDEAARAVRAIATARVLWPPLVRFVQTLAREVGQ